MKQITRICNRIGERKQCQVCGVVQYAQNLICVNCGSQNLMNYHEKAENIGKKQQRADS